jgi:uncharacterized protein (TIGR02001 family)
MIKSRIAIAGALLAAAGVASAGEFSVTPTIASDYDWRGFSQTNPDWDGKFGSGVAFQLAADYGFDNGFYVGAWGSNVDFGSSKPDVELDVYAGYAGGDSESGIGYDFGINTYNYPSASSINFWEAYAGIEHGVFSGKLWFTTDFAGSSDNALYVEGNVNYPLPSMFSLMAHVGYSFGDYWKPGNSEYIDYSAGVGYDIDNFAVAVKYVNTDVSGYNDDKVVLSVSTTLPWGG